jgi:hypothetical protein
MNIRPATAADIALFYGEIEAPVRMLVLEQAGAATGLAGLVLHDDGAMAGSWLLDAAQPRAAMLLAIAALGLIEQCSGPVYARPDPDEPTAPSVLRLLGFHPTPDGECLVYRTDLPGRFYLRHAHRTAGSLSADAGGIGKHASAGGAARSAAGHSAVGSHAVDGPS